MMQGMLLGGFTWRPEKVYRVTVDGEYHFFNSEHSAYRFAAKTWIDLLNPESRIEEIFVVFATPASPEVE